MSQPFGLENGALPAFIAVPLFGAAAYYLRSRFSSQSWVVGLLIYIGIPFGILLDVIVDWSIFHRDRNLFAFEVLVWWVIALLPVDLGLHLGSLSSGRRE